MTPKDQGGARAAPRAIAGFGSPLAHHALLADPLRVLAYRASLFAHAPGQVVLDLGCGTGLLSIFAAQAGARHVYAVEQGKVGALARLMFKANGVEDRVTLLRGHSRDVELPERVDVIVHEILGVDPLAEDLLASIEDARARFLKPGGRLLPGRVQVLCVGLPPLGWPPHHERLKREAEELGRLYGIDLGPYALALDAYETGVVLATEKTWPPGSAPEPITEEATLYDLDLSAPLGLPAPRRITLTATAAGTVGAVMLYFRAHLDDRLTLATGPFAPRTHWGWTVRGLGRAATVHPGDRLALDVRVELIDEVPRVLLELA